jgi:hypothetical protein
MLFRTVKELCLVLWMCAVIFSFVMLHGSQEFWSLAGRLGLIKMLQGFNAWLLPYFTAGYLS